jgi:hypothetical protein
MFTDAEKIGRYGISKEELRAFKWIQNANPTFPEFFVRAYPIPYDNWSALSHREFDFIIRFENLQADFANVLRQLGIEPLRPLPVKNKTGEKQSEFLAYYTPDVIPHAKRVFGHFMCDWGYTFPPDWGDYTPSKKEALEFIAWRRIRRAYWRHANRTSNPLLRRIGLRLKQML